jgi:DNA adenine methylase
MGTELSEHLKFSPDSVLRYPGGKGVVRSLLRHYRPLAARHLREPFCGGASVFFEVSFMFETAWLNDLHAGLMALYTALRDRPTEFIAACRAIEPARPDDPMTPPGPRGGAPKNARLKSIFDSLKNGGPDGDEALRYLFVNRCVYGSGRVNYDLPSRLTFGSSEGWTPIVTSNRLEEAAAALQGVRLTRGDYHSLLEEPGEDVWIFADPPYFCNTELSRTSQQYQHSFRLEDHAEFAEAVRNCRHHVAITYDDCPLVRKLFPTSEYWIEPLQWAYAGTTSAEKKIGRELLVMNYKPPVWDAIHGSGVAS